MTRTPMVFASLVVLMGLVLSLVSYPIFSGATNNDEYGPGPISTFPRSWDDPCGFAVQGNETTVNNVTDNTLPGAASVDLSQVYSTIVSSTAFLNLAAGRSWVTIEWDISGMQNRTGSYDVVNGDFVFLSGGAPDGYAQVDYYLDGGQVSVVYTGPLISFGCPPDASASFSANLVRSNGSNPTVYPIGQPVGINFTDADFTVANMTITASTPCLGNFTVIQGFNTDGPVVYSSAQHPGCSGPSLKVVLNPKQAYTQIVEWNQTYDNGTQLPPGDYQITADVAADRGQVYPMPVGEIIITDETSG